MTSKQPEAELASTRRSARRSELAESSDPRAIRMRSAILDAAEQVAEQQRGGRLSMAEIAAHAGVARAAIYAHFADVDDLLTACITRDLEAIRTEDGRLRGATGTSPRSATEHGVQFLLEHALARRNLYRWALGGPSPAGNLLIDLVAGAMDAVIIERAPDMEPRARDAVGRFLAGGVVASIAHALRAESRERIEDRAAAMLIAMPEWLLGAER